MNLCFHYPTCYPANYANLPYTNPAWGQLGRPSTNVLIQTTYPLRNYPTYGWNNTVPIPTSVPVPVPVPAPVPARTHFFLNPFRQTQLRSQLVHPPDIFPHLDWDFRQFPSQAKKVPAPGSQTAPDFRKSALKDPLPGLTIRSDQQGLQYYMGIWGPIFTTRTDNNMPGVTIEDVLTSIFRYFQWPLHQSDVRTMGEWHGALLAFQRRVEDSPNSYASAYERRRGPLRVDLLAACCGTRFAGLSPCVGSQTEFRLAVRP